MDVREAIKIGELANSTIVAGHGGVGRQITSIEVMEVPEVISWVTPGILVMTAFYSIRHDERKQVEIVQTLIDKEAAGIVIKLGRFVDSIPVDMIAIANEKDFPIIVIPKSVSYINVLTPLYEKLYEEKQLVDSVNNPFAEFESKSHASLSEALDEINDIVGSPVYIEDMEGALMYSSKDFLPNGWRKSDALFSKPEYPSYSEVLDDWKISLATRDRTILKIEGFRDCLILPLVSNQQVFATIHISYVERLHSIHMSSSQLKTLVAKLNELFMNEQLYLQKKRIEHLEQLEEFSSRGQDEEEYFVIRFQANWTEKLISSSPYLLDPSCLVLKELHALLTGLLVDRSVIIFEKYYHFYAVVKCNSDEYSMIIGQLSKRVNEVYDDLFVAAGPLLGHSRLLDDAIRLVDKTMEIGRKLQQDETFYTYDKLGIYEILIGLTADEHVQNYANTLLSPLLQGSNKELLDTLQMYLNENGNATKTSEKLFIHRRTLTYRLQKIEELLNVNMDDAESRFILQFCLKIKQLSG
ncbi:PucR family transcriptional regulator [Sporosarcina sp. OR05]|uniref:PucR family transcriptional regulator n=1 Tax=Sporosarcina sp. OR05 TaxID=2969819 RepID=UPI00352B3D3F